MSVNIRNRKNNSKNRLHNLGRNKTHATLKERRNYEQKRKLEQEKNNEAIQFIEENTPKPLKTPIPKKIMKLLKRLVTKGNTKENIYGKVAIARNIYNQNEKKKKQLLKKFRSGIQLNTNEFELLIKLHKYDNELPYDIKVIIEEQQKYSKKQKNKTLSKSKVNGPYEIKYLTDFNKLHPTATYEERQYFINELRKLFKYNTYKLNRKNPLFNKRKKVWL